MDKKQLHHLLTKVRSVSATYLVAAVVVSASISVFALRNNNLRMIALRDQVYQADKNNGDVEGALQKLRAYVYGNMNTSLTNGGDSVYPPIQLKYTYERLQAAANTKAQQANGQVYTDGQKYCEQQDSTDFSGRNRVPCIEQYVASHGVQVQKVPDAMYKFDFISPTWSPDFAGISLLVSVLLLLFFIMRLAAEVVLRRATR